MTEPKEAGVATVVFWIARFALKATLWALVIMVPVLGVWAASSLAVYWDGPRWAAVLAGLAAFPLLPLAWEALSARRHARRESPPKRFLTFGDRLIVRTFLISFFFLGGFLALWPIPIFEALASRGDWMLEGHDDPRSESIREALHHAADRMAWLYELAQENEFESESDAELPTPAPTPTPRDDRRAPDPVAPSGVAPSGRPPSAPTLPVEPHARLATTRGDRPPRWPLPDTPHPVVVQIPRGEETSIEAVARYVAAHEDDPYLRVKALHDWVADRIAYDAPSLAAGRYPPQDAQTVFDSRIGVCAGYAHLMVALGDAIGEHIVYLTGNVRDEDDGISGAGHAWNAAEIEGRWYLLDATWDAGSVDGPRFTRQYKSDYFLTPPTLFSQDHLPDEVDWQLREIPLTRGDFVRQPRLSAGFHRAGFELVSPQHSHLTVGRDFAAEIRSSAGHFLLASYRTHGTNGEGQRCETENGRSVNVRCRLPSAGTWDVVLFESPERFGTYWSVGSFIVVRQ